MLVDRRVGVGSRITISMSKTRKITASRKNRVEKGRRAERDGSNPHSNGDSFSRSAEDRALRVSVRVNRSRGKRRAGRRVTRERCIGGMCRMATES